MTRHLQALAPAVAQRRAAHPELALACPACKAQPRDWCASPSGRRLTQAISHPSRVDAWTAAAAIGPATAQ